MIGDLWLSIILKNILHYVACFPKIDVESKNYDAGISFRLFLDLTFSCHGYIGGWILKTHAAGSVYLDVFQRHSGTIFKLKAKTKVTIDGAGLHTITLPGADIITVTPGDAIGYHYDNDSSSGILSVTSSLHSMSSVTYTLSDLSRVYKGSHFDSTFSVGSLFGPTDIGTGQSIPTFKPILGE